LKFLRKIGAAWGIMGVVLILASAISRVLPYVHDAFRYTLSAFEILVLILWLVFMLITEGYRGFQKSFSPRVVARAWQLAIHGKPIQLILAPLYCMGYFHTTRKRIITSWTLTVGIILLILIVHTFPQPWRGIIDSGVIAGLLYGLVWILIISLRTFKNPKSISDSEG